MKNTQQLAAITNPILDGSTGSDVTGAQSGSLFFSIITGVLEFMMVLAALIVLINLVQSGVEWISGGGDNTKLENARSRITNSILGLIVLAASYAIWILVKDFLGIDVTFGPLFP